MRIAYFVGTAGSGKSSLTAAYAEWLKQNEQSVATVNLDPAATVLPYEPEVDIREYVDYERMMLTYNLGPNAALIASVREAVREIDTLCSEIMDLSVDYVLIDTPGQLELFAFRKEGRAIVKALRRVPSIIIYLMDPVASHTTRLFASSLFLATSVYLSLNLQSIIAISKIDIVPKRILRRIRRWISSQEALEVDIESRSQGMQMLITRDIVHILHDIGRTFPVIAVSSKTLEGLGALHGAVTRALSEGEYELR
ncbi:hypothetical protein HRbin02_01008 [Candidatus Calditenuaceae archaeon HR02]|nr:hypothetical protein HRbin02_01008 [Candidatus Calditenuaceae archaeon HR02]